MGISVGGTITIGIRDLAALPQSDEECRAFCVNIIGDECWAKINSARMLAASGASSVRARDVVSPELTKREVSIGISISGTF